jgi:hypothetical protein
MGVFFSYKFYHDNHQLAIIVAVENLNAFLNVDEK